MINGKPGGSPVNVRINDKIAIHNFDPNSGSLITNTFDITPWIHEGNNVLRIEMLGGRSAYWLTLVALDFFN